MLLPVTAAAGGVLAFLQLALSGYVVLGRWKWRLNLGDGGNKAMEMRVRAHGNFVEYVPMTLVLLALDELGGLPLLWVQLLAGALVLGRCMHAFGLTRVRGVSVGRFGGMVLTYAALGGAAAGALLLAAGGAPGA